MNCVMCEVATISPFSRLPSFGVCVCNREHYQCVRCDDEMRKHCGLCGENTHLIYVDLRFADEEREMGSARNSYAASKVPPLPLGIGHRFSTGPEVVTLWRNQNISNWDRSQSLIDIGSQSTSMVATKPWHPEFPLGQTYRKPNNDSNKLELPHLEEIPEEDPTTMELCEEKSDSVSFNFDDPLAICRLLNGEHRPMERGLPLKHFKSIDYNFHIAPKHSILIGIPYKEQRLIESPTVEIFKTIPQDYPYKQESIVYNTKKAGITAKRTNVFGYPKKENIPKENNDQVKPLEVESVNNGLPFGSHEPFVEMPKCSIYTTKDKSIPHGYPSEFNNSSTKPKVMYLDDYTAEEKRLLIGYPYQEKSPREKSVRYAEEDMYEEKLTYSSNITERTYVKDEKAYAVENKGVLLSFPCLEEKPENELKTLFHRNNAAPGNNRDDNDLVGKAPITKDLRTYNAKKEPVLNNFPYKEDLNIGTFSAEQENVTFGCPFLTKNRSLKFLSSEPKSLNPSDLRNHISLVRRVRLGTQNLRGWNSEMVTCPQDLVADLLVRLQMGKVVLPMPVQRLITKCLLTKCPDLDCEEHLYTGNINDHLATCHRSWIVYRLELNQPKSFRLDLRLTNQNVRCHAVMQVPNVVNEWGFVQKHDLLPILIMSMQVHLGEILVNRRLNQKLTLIWAATLISDCLPLKIVLTLWPTTGDSPESIMSFTGSPYDIRQSLRPIDLVRSGKVIILTADQVDSLTHNGRDLVSIQMAAMMGQVFNPTT
ncbi:uncharacterized protein LOC108046447 [Drosophila rhopaloa]|uniref:Uncharacterized protein LOC108046447 n=1 Tax=Drosophila rhopaloa TaxID=1041015 RepID=A0A6P4EXX3_DRORH|nr:uncharacterized protein LOC108046447 [Drosophila rhopaloa]